MASPVEDDFDIVHLMAFRNSPAKKGESFNPALNQSAIFGFFSRNLSKYVTDGAGPIENFLKKWVAGQGLELGISRMADHCSNHYTKLTAC